MGVGTSVPEVKMIMELADLFEISVDTLLGYYIQNENIESRDNNLAFVQGFGRSTRNDVTLREENGVLYLFWCGLIFRKVMK